MRACMRQRWIDRCVGRCYINSDIISIEQGLLDPPSAPRPSNRVITANPVLLFQNRLVEFVPVVKIVQAYRIFRSGTVVGNAARAENTLARGVIGVITAHRGVMLLDRFAGKRLGVCFTHASNSGYVGLSCLMFFF